MMHDGTWAVALTIAAWAGVLIVGDLRHRLLSNWLTLGGAAVALAAWWGYGGNDELWRAFGAASVAGLFLFVPFLVRGAGGGDVKMLFAAGAMAGWKGLVALLWYTSLAGLLLAVVMIAAGRADAARLKHYARCGLDWRYDRKAGAKALPPRDNWAVRVPFSIAIGAGLLVGMFA